MQVGNKTSQPFEVRERPWWVGPGAWKVEGSAKTVCCECSENVGEVMRAEGGCMTLVGQHQNLGIFCKRDNQQSNAS